MDNQNNFVNPQNIVIQSFLNTIDIFDITHTGHKNL